MAIKGKTVALLLMWAALAIGDIKPKPHSTTEIDCGDQLKEESSGSRFLLDDHAILAGFASGSPLSPEEERALLIAVKQGAAALTVEDWKVLEKFGIDLTSLEVGAEARAVLVERNMRIPVSVSLSFRDQFHRVPRLHLVFVGREGLEKAVDDFNLSHTTRFSTYATWKVRHAMQFRIFQDGYLARVPAHRLEALRRWNSVRQGLEQSLGRPPTFQQTHDRLREVTRSRLAADLKREPTPDELKQRLPSDFEDAEVFAREMRKAARHANILLESQLADTTPSADGEALPILESAVDHEAPDPFNEMLRLSFARAIDQAIHSAGGPSPLTPREALILSLRFGLTTHDHFFRLIQARLRDAPIDDDALAQLGAIFLLSGRELDQICVAHNNLGDAIRDVLAVSEDQIIPLDPVLPSALERLGTLFQRTGTEVDRLPTVPLSLRQTGFLVGISYESVRKLEPAAKEKLRAWVVERVGEFDPREDIP